MAITQVNPYLIFNGDAAEALRLYERALGANVEGLMRFSEVQGMEVAPEHRDRIIHAALRVGGALLMLSDAMPDQPVAREGNVEVCLDFDDVGDLRSKFEALAAGGQVRMPPQDTFWGATFGMLTDRFGVRWMLNCMKKP